MDAGYDHPPRAGAPEGRIRYAPTRVRSFGPSARPVVRSFGPVGPARWGVCDTPLHRVRSFAPTPKRINKPTGRRPPTPKRINNSPGRLRTAPAGAGKLAGYPKGPNARTTAGGPSSTRPNLAGVPDAPGLFLRVRMCHFGPPLRYDHIAIFPLISFSTPPKSTLSLWQIFT